ncbi:MAG TPA: CBS domain-containing protein [Longimicrobiales bacterium]|nr:CBS domain-containing protein [Longimicrobiales bacterium]
MRLVELLPREHVLVPMHARTVAEAVDLLLGRLAQSGAFADAGAVERVRGDLLRREMVTIGGIALLPHSRTEAVEELTLALGVATQPLELGTGTGDGPRIVVLVLAPLTAATFYLQTMATLARLLRQPDTVEQILRAGSADALLQLAPIADARIQPRLTVRDIMTHHVESVGAEATVRDVVDLMTRRRTRSVPVVGEKGEVVGMITERDVMRALLPQIPRAGEEKSSPDAADVRVLRAREIMTRSVLCVSEEMGLEEAANMMINKDVEQLPVVSEGKLTGIVTRADMIRKIFGR